MRGLEVWRLLLITVLSGHELGKLAHSVLVKDYTLKKLGIRPQVFTTCKYQDRSKGSIIQNTENSAKRYHLGARNRLGCFLRCRWKYHTYELPSTIFLSRCFSLQEPSHERFVVPSFLYPGYRFCCCPLCKTIDCAPDYCIWAQPPSRSSHKRLLTPSRKTVTIACHFLSPTTTWCWSLT